MPNQHLVAAIVVACACALPAQTFVVDAANGPGASFVDLPAAIAAVPDGAVLLVRPGTYGQIAVAGKSLSILATGPGVVITAPGVVPISVGNLASHQAVTLRGLTEQGATVFQRCVLRDCDGPVLVDQYTSQTTGTGPADLYADAIDVVNCRQVTLRNCHLRAFAALYASSSDVAVETCDLIGQDAAAAPNPSLLAGNGARINRGTVTFARCQVQGGNGLLGTASPGGPEWAISALLAEVRICDDGTGYYAAGQQPSSWIPAIAGGSSTVVRDPSAVVLGNNLAPAVDVGLVDVVRPLPSLRTIAGPPGGTVRADVPVPIGELVLLAVSLPGPVTAVPAIDGSFRLDPATATLVALGVPQPLAPLTCSVAVPNLPWLVGARSCWQAVAWSSADGLRASNPSTCAN